MTSSLDPAVEDLLRHLTPQVLGAVVRRYGHFDLAEDAVQEALLAAATQWPRTGVPDQPRSWMITVASRRLTDLLRSEQARRRREHDEARHRLPGDWLTPDPGGGAVRAVSEGDDSLAVPFLCCHPALTTASQIALTLRAVAGLTTREVARSFLVPEASMTRRITRAKRQIAEAGARFTIGSASEWRDRLTAVLHVLYLVYTEGYTATSGPDLARPELTHEAIRLTRLVLRVHPHESEAAGLLALMLLTESRRPARTGADGALLPLDAQDRALWDHALIAEGVALVETALSSGPVGPYQLQAAIAAIHAEAGDVESTDWAQIVALYDLLLEINANPVVELNRAVAVAMHRGPAAGLAIVDSLAGDRQLAAGHRWHSVRAQLLERLGRADEARDAYLRAARLTTSLPHVRYLNEQANRLAAPPMSGS